MCCPDGRSFESLVSRRGQFEGRTKKPPRRRGQSLEAARRARVQRGSLRFRLEHAGQGSTRVHPRGPVLSSSPTCRQWRRVRRGATRGRAPAAGGGRRVRSSGAGLGGKRFSPGSKGRSGPPAGTATVPERGQPVIRHHPSRGSGARPLVRSRAALVSPAAEGLVRTRPRSAPRTAAGAAPAPARRWAPLTQEGWGGRRVAASDRRGEGTDQIRAEIHCKGLA